MHVRHLTQARRENDDLVGSDAQLACFRATRLTANADDVAQFDAINNVVEFFLALVESIANIIRLEVEMQQH